MSPLRIILRDLRVWSVWTRSGVLNTVVRRCRKDKSVREVIQCFRQTFFRPRRTLLISATAAYKTHENDDEKPTGCDKNITDDELQALLTELDNVETLSKTLFCCVCGKRCVIDKKIPGVTYCVCKTSEAEESDRFDGWVPYMEAEDVIIWRKEYKTGMGLYAYKVYGRYPEVKASDFAAIQVDGAYRKKWDSAVASLSIVERSANGLPDQSVLHWEVLWPRLFANRDYVYIRRHKEFDVESKSPSLDFLHPTLIRTKPEDVRTLPEIDERPCVHSNAKRKALEMDSLERQNQSRSVDNKVYVIISRSCEHPNVPETKHAIRVCEYWSHMVVKTLNGAEKSGMEFVLTYYDEPAVGGMPSSVAAWASGRAAPAYLQRMRRAASDYGPWRHTHQQDLPELMPFVTDPSPPEEEAKPCSETFNEQDMESSRSGPDLENQGEDSKRDQGTQTDTHTPVTAVETQNVVCQTNIEVKVKEEKVPEKKPLQDGDTDKLEEDENNKNGGWWRYLYPFYYFV